MPDVRSNTAPREFASLTKKQKRWVRKLAWESLKSEAGFIVVIPWAVGCLGALIGFFPGVVLGHLAYPYHHPTLCFVMCIVMGAGIGAWIGWMWLARECQTRFKNIIKENEDRISRIV
jgi:hypothetical protein